MSDKKKSILSMATENLGFPEFLPEGVNEDDVYEDDEETVEIRMDTAVPEVNFEEASHHHASQEQSLQKK